MASEQLKLKNQLCFPVYAASRLIIREYQPHLDKLGITYPQYLVLMILWESDGITVNDITQSLMLNTNTVTPLLKRMAALRLITRERSKSDERKVIIKLTEKGKKMHDQAIAIPEMLAQKLLAGPLDENELLDLKEKLYRIIGFLSSKSAKK